MRTYSLMNSSFSSRAWTEGGLCWVLLSLWLQVSPDQQQQHQQQGADEACQLPPAQVDLSFVVQGEQGVPPQRVAVVVSD